MCVLVCVRQSCCVCVRVLYFLILFVVAVRLWCLPRDQSQVRERVGEGDDGDGSSSNSSSCVDVDSACGSEADLLPRALTIRMFHVSILLFYFLCCSFRVSFFDADQIVRLSAFAVCAYVCVSMRVCVRV